MMFKLIFFLVGLAIAIILSAINLGNTSNISFGFKVLQDVPVFFSISISFLAGAIFTLPFAFSVSFNKKRAKKKTDRAEFVPDNKLDDIVNQNVNDTDV